MYNITHEVGSIMNKKVLILFFSGLLVILAFTYEMYENNEMMYSNHVIEDSEIEKYKNNRKKYNKYIDIYYNDSKIPYNQMMNYILEQLLIKMDLKL